MSMKKISKHSIASKKREGGGFMVRRPIGESFDPFLMLDHLGPVNYGPGEAVGAPDHPHRGFETVTYLIDGEVFHQDSVGNSGKLSRGWCQWMTAGSGVVHSEMPTEDLLKNGGRMEGFQLWVNLPKKDKMAPPRYQDTPPERIPVVQSADKKATVKVIAGECLNQNAVIETKIPIMYLDICVEAGGQFDVSIPPNYNSFVYCWKGSGFVGEEKRSVTDGHMTTLSEDGDSVRLEASPQNNFHALVIGGVPIKEPIARHGPFVMNTQDEIEQAFDDYRSGKLGQISGAEERRAATNAAVAKSKQSGSYYKQ